MKSRQAKKKKPLHSNPVLLPNNIFVGRAQELQELKSGLESVAAGQSRLFMMEGRFLFIERKGDCDESANRKQGQCV